jgi:hypothetical protein
MPAAKKCLIAVIGGGLGVLSLATPAGAQADPPGDNGTVKIDGVAFDDHPDNQPHVGCTFQVDFYGFDEGDLDATVTFKLVPPTARDGDLTVDDVPSGEDAAGGGIDLDASTTYDLGPVVADVVPQPEQGIHVRLTVHAEGSIGADTKFKEFWITGCGSAPTTSSTTSTTTHGGSTTTSVPDGGTTSTTSPSDGSTTTAPGGGPTTMSGPGPSGGAQVSPAADSGGLPVTGSDPLPLVAAAAALAALGAGATVTARRMRAARSGR